MISTRGQKYILTFIFMIFCTPSMGTDYTGCIEGIIRSRYHRYADIEILLEKTSYSTFTDSSGYFILTDVDPGTYILYSPVLGMTTTGNNKKNVIVVAGDTAFANIIYTMEGLDSYSYSLELDEWWEPIELHFKLLAPPDRSCAGFRIFAEGSPCPIVIIDDDEYTVEVPPDFGEFTWSLPWLGERSLTLRDCRSTREGPVVLEAEPGSDPPWFGECSLLTPLDNLRFPLAQADYTIDEWESSEWEVEHNIVDPRLWGRQNLKRSGLIAFRMIFGTDDSEPWLLTMIYHEGYVILPEYGSGIYRTLDFTVTSARLSPSGKYALLKIADSNNFLTTPYLIMNTRTGIYRSFDPFPEMSFEEEQRYFRPASATIVHPVRTFFISDDGCVIGRFDEELRTYDETGEQIFVLYIKDYVGSYYPSMSFDVAADGEHWAILLKSLKSEPILLLGGIHEYSVCDLDTVPMEMHSRIELSGSGSVIALIDRNGSFRILNLDTGELAPFPFSGYCVNSPIFSNDGDLISCAIGDNGIPEGDYCCFIGHTDNLAEDIISFPGFTLHWRSPYPAAITNEGWLLLKLEERIGYNNRYRYAILDPSGNLVWMSHCLIRKHGYISYPFPGFVVSSPTLNRFAYCDGELIHILTFKRAEG